MTAFLAGGGFAGSPLSTGILATGAVNTIFVNDVTGFLGADALHPAYLQIDDEIFVYTANPDTVLNKFTSVVRAQTDPQTLQPSVPAAHAIGALVATQGNVKAINTLIGYDITSTGATFGIFDAIKLLGAIFTTIPTMLTWDFPWFTGQLALIRYVLMAFSGGFILSFVMGFINTMMSIFKP